MSQMVVPQNSPKSAPAEAAGSSRPGNQKSGESPFDAISRSEQKRLDAREANDARETRESETAKQSEKDRELDADAAKPGDDKSSGAEDPGKIIAQNPAADLEQAPQAEDDEQLTSSPLTFADLQSLVAPLQAQSPSAGAKAAAASPNAQGFPGVHNSLTSMAAISGNGKSGSMSLQTPGQAGSSTAMALAENLLAGVTGDGGKASDSPLLQNAIRFQGGLEPVGVQASAVNTPRMAPDASILRGYATSIELPVGHAEWGDKVAGKLTWLTAKNMSVAEIHLTPPDMGPMEVKVQVQQEQANITVHSSNPVVREQLELHSQRLRDMLSEQGISLENFDVSDSGGDQARDGGTERDERTVPGLMADTGQEDMGADLRSLDLTWKGEVDLFA